MLLNLWCPIKFGMVLPRGIFKPDMTQEEFFLHGASEFNFIWGRMSNSQLANKLGRKFGRNKQVNKYLALAGSLYGFKSIWTRFGPKIYFRSQTWGIKWGGKIKVYDRAC